MEEEKKEIQRDDAEFIELSRASTPYPRTIKIKIKERVSYRRSQKITLPVKILAVIVAAIFGFIVGSKIALRYCAYWAKPHIKFHSLEGNEASELEEGQEFFADMKNK